MRILIINPNSSIEMSETIQRSAEVFVDGRYDVTTVPVPTAPPFIDTYYDKAVAALGMLEIVKRNQATYDAFIVACHCDPNLDLLKEATTKPVVGIGEASMKMASMLGHSFSVLSTCAHSVPNKEVLIRKYHLEGCLASIRYPEESCSYEDEVDMYLTISKDAIKEDLAEVLVLGCAGLAGMDKKLQDQLGVPVLDPIICALTITEGLVRAGYGISKVRRYEQV